MLALEGLHFPHHRNPRVTSFSPVSTDENNLSLQNSSARTKLKMKTGRISSSKFMFRSISREQMINLYAIKTIEYLQEDIEIIFTD